LIIYISLVLLSRKAFFLSLDVDWPNQDKVYTCKRNCMNDEAYIYIYYISTYFSFETNKNIVFRFFFLYTYIYSTLVQCSSQYFFLTAKATTTTASSCNKSCNGVDKILIGVRRSRMLSLADKRSTRMSLLYLTKIF